MAAPDGGRHWPCGRMQRVGDEIDAVQDRLADPVALAAGVAVGCLATLLITVAWLARRSLDRRRMAAWDADWLATGPRWTPRR